MVIYYVGCPVRLHRFLRVIYAVSTSELPPLDFDVLYQCLEIRHPLWLSALKHEHITTIATFCRPSLLAYVFSLAPSLMSSIKPKRVSGSFIISSNIGISCGALTATDDKSMDTNGAIVHDVTCSFHNPSRDTYMSPIP